MLAPEHGWQWIMHGQSKSKKDVSLNGYFFDKPRYSYPEFYCHHYLGIFIVRIVRLWKDARGI